DLLPLSVRRPHSSTLFPYTTLFRSQPVPDRAHRVRDRRADVAEQVAVEFVQALARVLQLRRLHLLQHPRMAQDRALAEDHQRARSEEHTSELQSRENLVCRLLLEKK